MLINENLVRTIFPFEEKTVAKKILCCLKKSDSMLKAHRNLIFA